MRIKKNNYTLNELAFKFLIVLSLSLILPSCRSVLQNTLGRYTYKKEFLPSKSLKSDFHVEIPYEVIDGKIIVRLRLNAKQEELNFIFDTGARTIISDSLVKDLNLFPVASEQSEDINGYVSNTNLYKINVFISGFGIMNLGVLSKDFEDISKGCVKIDGILGKNVLDQAVFHFDCQRKLLIITNSINDISEENKSYAARLHRQWNGDSFLRLKVNKHRAKFQFDTGAGNFLFVKSELFEKEKPFKQKIGIINALNSSKINKRITYYRINNIEIGNLTVLDDLDCYIASFDGNKSNLFGAEIFKYYNITIDGRGERLYFSNRKVDSSSINLKIPNLKIDWLDGRTFISGITVNSKLQKMGLTLNDSVVSINNVLTSRFVDYCNFKSFLATLENMNEFDIVILKNNSERKYNITSRILYE
jgi:hypothetical protein